MVLINNRIPVIALVTHMDQEAALQLVQIGHVRFIYLTWWDHIYVLEILVQRYPLL